MSDRRVSIAEADVDSASGTMLWIRDNDQRFAVIVPEGVPTVRAGTKVSITGHLTAGSQGAPQIRADRIEVK
jgi:hypothetical protein